MGHVPANTVFLVEDDCLQLDLLSKDLQSEGLAVQTFSSAEAFLVVLDATTTGCVVVDVRLPGMSGVELVRELAVRNERLSAIAITGFSDGTLAVAAQQAGAVHFLHKPLDPKILARVIRDAMRGLFTRVRLRAEAQRVAATLAQLSRRERQVLDKTALGLSIKEIGRLLSLSPKSVETYRARLAEKLQAGSPVSLMRMALLAATLELTPSAEHDDKA